MLSSGYVYIGIYIWSNGWFSISCNSSDLFLGYLLNLESIFRDSGLFFWVIKSTINLIFMLFYISHDLSCSDLFWK